MNFLTAEISALLSALFWALGVVLLKKGEKGSVTMQNLFRHIVATLFFGIVVFFMCHCWNFPSLENSLILLLNSLFGIVFAETLFLKSLKIMGAGRTAIIGTLYSPVTIILSLLFLSEKITFIESIGGIIAFTSTVIIVQKGKGHFSRYGVIIAILSVLFNAIGTLLLKDIIDILPILEVTFLRLLFSIPILYAINRVRHGSMIKNFRAVIKDNFSLFTIIGTLLADGIASFLWLNSIHKGSVTNATLLGQTAPVFALLFSFLILKEKLPRLAIISIILSTIGGIIILR